jgi:hypothetical protein
MKKDDAMNKLNGAGHAINELNSSAWNTALHPTRYGWVSSIFSIASIPVLSAASIGHMVTSAVVSQIGDDTFQRITELGRKDEKGGDKPEP